MTTRKLSTYKAVVEAGPGDALVSVEIFYYDQEHNLLDVWSDNAMAFGYTWKDVARVVLEGIRGLKLRTDALSDPEHPSPHVDLT
jgi:hypothetical protein